MLHTKIIDTQKEQIKISAAEQFIASSKFGAKYIFYRHR
jgi:molybdopterin synthase catalytic subunit